MNNLRSTSSQTQIAFISAQLVSVAYIFFNFHQCQTLFFFFLLKKKFTSTFTALKESRLKVHNNNFPFKKHPSDQNKIILINSFLSN